MGDIKIIRGTYVLPETLESTEHKKDEPTMVIFQGGSFEIQKAPDGKLYIQIRSDLELTDEDVLLAVNGNGDDIEYWKYESIHQRHIDEFIRGYKAAAVWSSTHTKNDEDPVPIDSIDPEPEWSEEALNAVKETCEDFIKANTEDLIEYADKITYDSGKGTPYDYAGHDFWLTRNGHGVGFWDRDLDELGTRLTKSTEAFGGQDLYIGDDGKLYLM